jgi:hypothetical protein
MELSQQRNQLQLSSPIFDGRYLSLKYRIYLYNITRDEEIKQITTHYSS